MRITTRWFDQFVRNKLGQPKAGTGWIARALRFEALLLTATLSQPERARESYIFGLKLSGQQSLAKYVSIAVSITLSSLADHGDNDLPGGTFKPRGE